MRHQYGLSILKGYPVAFLLATLMIFGIEANVLDLLNIFLFSLLYAIPTALISYLFGFYVFQFALKHLKASYFANVIVAGLLTSLSVGVAAGSVFSVIIIGNILAGTLLFFIIP